MSAVKEPKKSDKSAPKVPKPFNYIGKSAPRSIEEVKMAWWAYHGYTWTGIRNYCPALLKLALKMKYIQWPWKIKDYFFQKDVLDLWIERERHRSSLHDRLRPVVPPHGINGDLQGQKRRAA